MYISARQIFRNRCTVRQISVSHYQPIIISIIIFNFIIIIITIIRTIAVLSRDRRSPNSSAFSSIPATTNRRAMGISEVYTTRRESDDRGCSCRNQFASISGEGEQELGDCPHREEGLHATALSASGWHTRIFSTKNK